MKRKIKLLLGVVPALILVGTVAAILYYQLSWTQNLTVPTPQLTVYASDGTILTQSSDYSGYWVWVNHVGQPSEFEMNITIVNTGTIDTTFNVAFSGLSGNWTGDFYMGEPNNFLHVGESKIGTLRLWWQGQLPYGESTGWFTVTVTAPQS